MPPPLEEGKGSALLAQPCTSDRRSTLQLGGHILWAAFEDQQINGPLFRILLWF
jgi:hypothetical protein